MASFSTPGKSLSVRNLTPTSLKKNCANCSAIQLASLKQATPPTRSTPPAIQSGLAPQNPAGQNRLAKQASKGGGRGRPP